MTGIEIVLGMVLLTMPATPQPVTYTATSGSIVLGYRPYDGWVPAHLCFNQCRTFPGQPVQLLRGELSLADLADNQVLVLRDGLPVLSFWRFPFGGVPVYSLEGAAP